MAGVIPDLTPTIIDDETGEVLFQGQEGPEVEFYRARARENMDKWRRERKERRALQKAESATGEEVPSAGD